MERVDYNLQQELTSFLFCLHFDFCFLESYWVWITKSVHLTNKHCLFIKIMYNEHWLKFDPAWMLFWSNKLIFFSKFFGSYWEWLWDCNSMYEVPNRFSIGWYVVDILILIHWAEKHIFWKKIIRCLYDQLWVSSRSDQDHTLYSSPGIHYEYDLITWSLVGLNLMENCEEGMKKFEQIN